MRGSYSPISPGVLLAVVRVTPVLRAVVASIIAPRASVAIVVPRARRTDQGVAGTLPGDASVSDRRPEMNAYRNVPRASLAARRSRVYRVAAKVFGRRTSASSSRWSFAGSVLRLFILGGGRGDLLIVGVPEVGIRGGRWTGRVRGPMV